MPPLALNPKQASRLSSQPNIIMKHLLIILCLLLLSPAAQAGWFSKDETPDYKQKISTLEFQLIGQRKTSDQWILVSGILGIGCVLIFVIGTALGARTRKHYDGTRRMGPT